MSGEGFLAVIGKLRVEVVKKRQVYRRAEDDLAEAEHKLQEAIVLYNDSLPGESVQADAAPTTKPG